MDAVCELAFLRFRCRDCDFLVIFRLEFLVCRLGISIRFLLNGDETFVLMVVTAAWWPESLVVVRFVLRQKQRLGFHNGGTRVFGIRKIRVYDHVNWVPVAASHRFAFGTIPKGLLPLEDYGLLPPLLRKSYGLVIPTFLALPTSHDSFGDPPLASCLAHLIMGGAFWGGTKSKSVRAWPKADNILPCVEIYVRGKPPPNSGIIADGLSRDASAGGERV
ncbi:hypothetical protein V8G54_018140 [Vigna mungo]|uniref:Uncharacterized protein n=1 Tax=Vigna mungo TaxID=3915 RepID=A0AAQ3RR67_VIGMU